MNYKSGHNGLSVLLLLFVAGAAVVQRVSPDAIAKLTMWQTAMMFFLPILLSLFLFGSVYGWILLPVCAMLFGCGCGLSAPQILTALRGGEGDGLRLLVTEIVLTPCFFLLARIGIRFSVSQYRRFAEGRTGDRELLLMAVPPALLTIGSAAVIYLALLC